MKRLILTTTLFTAIAFPAWSQNAEADKAKARLDEAVKASNAEASEYSDLRRALYREINKLDDEALALQKELRSLEFQETQRTANLRRTETALANRKTEFDYSGGVLRQYAKTLPTRMHPAENQKYLSDIEAAERAASANIDNATKELEELLKVATLGMNRLQSSIGGNTFEGKALRNGTEAMQGTFGVFGPSVYFSSKDGKFQGVSPISQAGTEYPNVLSIKTMDAPALTSVFSTKIGSIPVDGTMGKALEVEANEDTLMDTIKKGGLVGHCILALGAISLLIVIYKLLQISRFYVPSRRDINAIIDALVNERAEEAARLAKGMPGMSGDMVRTGVQYFYDKRKVLEEALFEKLMGIKPSLDKFLPFLALTAAVAPLMGLLGTVLGIIKTFQSMVLYGTGNAKNFSAGISEALITTAEGLVVAIPVLVLHGLMKSLAKAKSGEIEGIAIALMNGTTEIDRGKSKNTSKETTVDDDDFELNLPAKA
jgi:biopolymer transport protein ExbB